MNKKFLVLFLLLFSVSLASALPVCGDMDNSDSINIADLVYLAQYMFQDGPEPFDLFLADVDSDGFVNIADLVYLAQYMFQDGPEPVCIFLQPTILHPEPNDIVSGLTYVAVENQGALDSSEVMAVKLYYSIDNIDWVNLYTAKSSSGNLWEFTLNPDDLDSGLNYLMVIFETSSEARTSPSVPIQVNKMPVASALYSFEGNNDYSFDASDSFDSDGSINSFFWEYDDGQTDSGVNVSHQFSTSGEHAVSLTVTDNQGAKAKDFFPVNPEQNPSDNCGCERITIKTTGNFNPDDYDLGSTIFASHFPSGYVSLGALDDIDMQNIGTTRFFVGTFFEVEAELTSGSTDSALCNAEQKIKNSFHFNETDYVLSQEGIECGFNGSNWCNDGFTEKFDSFRKNHKLDSVNWIDFPGIRLFKSRFVVEGLSSNSNFWVTLDGPLGSCECFFDQVISYDENGTMVSNSIENISGTNCFSS